jgi:hypothetical protein
MGDCQTDPQNQVQVEDVENGTTAPFSLHFDAVTSTKGCQYIYRAVLGPNRDGVNAYLQHNPPPPKPAVPSGSCTGGFADLIFVNGDGSVAESPGKRWVQVTDRQPNLPNPPNKDIPLRLSHHKSLAAMPAPYRAQVEACL